jgi:hypothetical protein
MTLAFPFLLDTTTVLQVKSGVTVTGEAIASWVTWYGAMATLNFTGTTWTALVSASAAAENVAGIAIQNTGTTTQVVGCRIVDGGAASKYAVYKQLAPGALWLLELRISLPLNWAVQVQQGAAGINGSAVCSTIPLP